MPYLKIQTNQPITPDSARVFVSKASRTVADALGKPERYVMVVLEPGVTMLFAGTEAPAAFLELKSIGLPQERAPALSKVLSDLVTAAFDVPADRIFIEFAAANPKLWGWNGDTF